ncbi:hypothetical protein D3C80_2182850 [compost metagenome]
MDEIQSAAEALKALVTSYKQTHHEECKKCLEWAALTRSAGHDREDLAAIFSQPTSSISKYTQAIKGL